jgi:hypothetical protein
MVHQQAINGAKATIAKDVVLAYPDFSITFEIYTDTSSKQLSLAITHGNCPLAFLAGSCPWHNKNTA